MNFKISSSVTRGEQGESWGLSKPIHLDWLQSFISIWIQNIVSWRYLWECSRRYPTVHNLTFPTMRSYSRIAYISDLSSKRMIFAAYTLLVFLHVTFFTTENLPLKRKKFSSVFRYMFQNPWDDHWRLYRRIVKLKRWISNRLVKAKIQTVWRSVEVMN